MSRTSPLQNSLKNIMGNAKGTQETVLGPRLRMIDTDKLLPNENNKYSMNMDNEFVALMVSIKERGVENPLIVTTKDAPDDYYRIISGHRRHKAASTLGLDQIPCRVVDFESSYQETAALVDHNATVRQKKPLDIAQIAQDIISLIQEDEQYKAYLCEKFLGSPDTTGISARSLAAKALAVSESTVQNALTLLKLGDTIKEWVEKEYITKEIAYTLAAREDLKILEADIAIEIEMARSTKEDWQDEKDIMPIVKSKLGNKIKGAEKTRYITNKKAIYKALDGIGYIDISKIKKEKDKVLMREKTEAAISKLHDFLDSLN